MIDPVGHPHTLFQQDDDQTENLVRYPPLWELTHPIAQAVRLQDLFQRRLRDGHVRAIAERLRPESRGEGIVVVVKPSVLVPESRQPLVEAIVPLLEAAHRRWPTVRANIKGLTPRWYSVDPRTTEMVQMLEEEQEGDFLCFHAQMGKRHGGLTPHLAVRQLESDEFPLCPYLAGNPYFTHRHLIGDNEARYFAAPGGIYAFRGDGKHLDSVRWEMDQLDWNFEEERPRTFMGACTGFRPRYR